MGSAPKSAQTKRPATQLGGHKGQQSALIRSYDNGDLKKQLVKELNELQSVKRSLSSELGDTNISPTTGYASICCPSLNICNKYTSVVRLYVCVYNIYFL